MKSNYFLKSGFLFLSLAAVLLVTTAVLGYSAPTSLAPWNSSEPVDQSGSTQQKSGNLAVNNFVARAPALFMGERNQFDGMLRGKFAQNNSSVRFGDAPTGPYTVNIQANGSMYAKAYLRSEALAHRSTAPLLLRPFQKNVLEPVCADASGKAILCQQLLASLPSVSSVSIEKGIETRDPYLYMTSITCKAAIGGPARAGGEAVNIQYKWSGNSYFGGQSGIDRCDVVIPQGATTAQKTITALVVDMNISNVCVVSSSLNIPSSLKC